MRISDWSSDVCSSDLMAIARLSSRAFLGLVSSRRGRPILLRPRAHLWGVALSLQFFPALRRRLLLLACLSAAAVLAGLPAATAETPPVEPAPFTVLPEGTAMVWQNMDTGKQVEGVVGRNDGLIVSWIWEGRSFSSRAHI